MAVDHFGLPWGLCSTDRADHRSGERSTPHSDPRAASGCRIMLLILGLRWLKKALLRIALPRMKKRASVEAQPLSPARIDWYSFVVAFKAVLLEGLEIAF